MRTARTESSSHQSQCQDLSFQRFRDFPVKSLAQESHQSLRTRFDPQTLSTECNPGASVQNVDRRKLLQLGLLDNQR
jgi:hypothetical protein